MACEQVHSDPNVVRGSERGEANRLGKVERDLKDVGFKLGKQRFRLQRVVGVLGLGLVAEDGPEQVFGHVELSCLYGSGASPQGAGCCHCLHIHRKSGGRSRHEFFDLARERENKSFRAERAIGRLGQGHRIVVQLIDVIGGLAMGVGVPETHEVSVVDGGRVCRLTGLASSR